MDEYTVEIDELHDDVVILAVPALRLLVFGRSIDEAMDARGRPSTFAGSSLTAKRTRRSQSCSSQPTRVGRRRRARPDCSVERSTMASPGADSILHLVQTLPGMVAIVVACVAAAIGALGGLALHGSICEVSLAATIGFGLVIAVMGSGLGRQSDTVLPSLTLDPLAPWWRRKPVVTYSGQGP